MKLNITMLLLLLASPAIANEALDVLEGKKRAADINLPPAAPGEPGSEPVEEKFIYIEPAWGAGPLDPVWARAVLFEDDSNPYVQHVAVTGFFEFQAAFGKAETDAVEETPGRNTELDSSRTRRARLGARMRAFYNTEIEAAAEFGGDSRYRGIERLGARTTLSENMGITYGKFRPAFTAEYAVEPEFLATPDRAMLTNMIAPARTLGVRFDHHGKDMDYGIGWFSGDSHPDFPGADGDGFLSFNLSRGFVEGSGDSAMRTRWHLDYIHNFDGGKSGSIPRYDVAGRTSANGKQLVARNPAFRHLFSTGVTIEQDRFSFLGDFTIAKGGTTVWGLTLSPAWWAIPGTLKIVGRYHYADTDDAGGLVTTMGASGDPLFDSTPFFVGDEYHSFYLGANVHLYQDRMLIMGGLEHAILKDEDGAGFNTDAWIWHTGAKVSF